MANDAEKDMDSRLKAYARKRRKAAGEAPELHPANRRLLQAEVARTYRRESAEGSAGTAIAWWPRLAWFGGMAAVVAVVAAVIVNLRPETESQMAMTAAKEAPTLESLEMRSEKEAEPLRAKTAEDAMAVDELKKDALPAVKAPASATPAPSSMPVAAPMDKAAAVGGAKPVKAETADQAGAMAGRGGASARPGEESALAASKPAQGPQGEIQMRQQFTRAPASGERLREDAGRVAGVLSSFELQQAGQQVRIIDADGSTYTGLLYDPALKMKPKASVALRESVKQAPQGTTFGLTAQESVPAEIKPGQDYFFVVSGTNRSLKQQVVFEGNYRALAQPPEEPAAARRLALPQQPAPSQDQFPLLRVQGKALIGVSNEIQVDAFPVQQRLSAPPP